VLSRAGSAYPCRSALGVLTMFTNVEDCMSAQSGLNEGTAHEPVQVIQPQLAPPCHSAAGQRASERTTAQRRKT